MLGHIPAKIISIGLEGAVRLGASGATAGSIELEAEGVATGIGVGGLAPQAIVGITGDIPISIHSRSRQATGIAGLGGGGDALWI